MSNAIEMVPIDEIKPDPNQPRKIKSPDQIAGLAKNFKQKGVGIINPIEVDDQGVIVTGEMRWLAAREAGFTEVPVKHYTPETPELRLLRQVSENIHQVGTGASRMSPLDTARAFRKMLDIEVKGGYGEPQEDDLGKPLTKIGQRGIQYTGPTADQGLHSLARRLGISHVTVINYLNFLDPKVTDPALAAAIDEGKVPQTMATLISVEVPKEHRAAFTKRVLEEAEKGRIHRDSARDVATALRQEPDDPQAVIDVLEAGKPRGEIAKKLRQIAPTLEETVGDALAPAEALEKAVSGAISAIRKVGNASMLHPVSQKGSYLAVSRLRDACDEFLAASGEDLAPIDGDALARQGYNEQ